MCFYISVLRQASDSKQICRPAGGCIKNGCREVKLGYLVLKIVSGLKCGLRQTLRRKAANESAVPPAPTQGQDGNTKGNEKWLARKSIGDLWNVWQT